MARPKKIIKNNEEPEPITETEEPEAPEVLDSPPEQELFSIEEAADYMAVNPETIRLWLDHGHLRAKPGIGLRKIPLESMINCRIKGRFFHTLPNKEYLRPDEVANYFSLSVKTIYGWIDSGQIEAVKVGPNKTVRIRREEVENMVQMKED